MFEKGVLYKSTLSRHTGLLIVLCTGLGINNSTFAGTVVKTKDHSTSPRREVGDHARNWNKDFFLPTKKKLKIK
jgi:hypothetical protein